MNSKLKKDDEIEIEDDEEAEDEASHVEFEIASYPSDLTLNVIHEMWKNKDISIPSFQRNFVWDIKQSSLLIESFLLGLPVPQVFFYIDSENKNLVVDGQQRILSIVFFFEGYFGLETLQGKRTVFRLTGLAKGSPYLNKRYEDLDLNDQRRLRGAVLRAVNIRQLAPANQGTSIFHIFERLNTGGTPLRPQEIRNCVFRGQIVDVLHSLNDDPNWRKVLGRKTLDKHQRDVEMILRVFAIADRGEKYEKPMKEFLNRAMKANASDKAGKIEEFKSQFKVVMSIVAEKLPKKPFNVRGPINLAALDSTLAVLIQNSRHIRPNLTDRFAALLKDENYRKAIFFNTSDAVTVKERLLLAKKYLIS